MVGCSKTSSEIKIIKHSFRNVSQIIDSREGQPLKTLRNDCFGIPSEKEIGIVYLLNSQCSTNKSEVISKLKNLNNISWRTHHSSIEERSVYHEASLSMNEAVNYVKMTLKMLFNEL